MEDDATVHSETGISQWVVYEHPRDYPEQYVLRRWIIAKGMIIATHDVVLADSLEEIRKAVPAGLYCLPRFAEDDPCIVESWL